MQDVSTRSRVGENNVVVVVVSPSKIMTEALCCLIQSFGFDAHAEPLSEADVALYDLVNLDSLPPPFSRAPALALTGTLYPSPATIVDYRGHLYPGEPVGALKQALISVSRGEGWSGGQGLGRVLPAASLKI